jgi:hypothetical protein
MQGVVLEAHMSDRALILFVPLSLILPLELGLDLDHLEGTTCKLFCHILLQQDIDLSLDYDVDQIANISLLNDSLIRYAELRLHLLSDEHDLVLL